MTASCVTPSPVHRGPVTRIQCAGETWTSASQTGVQLRPEIWLQPGFRVASFDRDGDRTLVVGGTPAETGEVSFYQHSQQRSHSRIADDRVVTACLLRETDQAVVGCADGRVLLLELPSLRPVRELMRHTAPCQQVRALGSHTVVSAGLDGLLFVHDLRTKETRDLTDHTAGVLSLALGENAIWSGALDGKVRVHSYSGRLRKTYANLRSPVVAIALPPHPAPNDTRPAAWVGLRDGRLGQLAQTGVAVDLVELPGVDSITDLTFDTAGRLILAADGRCRVFPKSDRF